MVAVVLIHNGGNQLDRCLINQLIKSIAPLSFEDDLCELCSGELGFLEWILFKEFKFYYFIVC